MVDDFLLLELKNTQQQIFWYCESASFSWVIFNAISCLNHTFKRCLDTLGCLNFKLSFVVSRVNKPGILLSEWVNVNICPSNLKFNKWDNSSLSRSSGSSTQKDIPRYPKLSQAIPRYPKISQDIQRYPKISLHKNISRISFMDMKGYLFWYQMISLAYPLISSLYSLTYSAVYLLMSSHIPFYPQISIDILWYPYWYPTIYPFMSMYSSMDILLLLIHL